MRTLLLALVVLAASPAVAVQPGEMFDDPALEARTRDLGRELRCLVCANQSIFDSNAGLARDLRAVLRERIAAGDTDAEALAFVSERYGDYVLLTPPLTAHTALLWAAPWVFLGAAIFAGGLYLRRRQPIGPAVSDAERTAARALLKERTP